MNHLYDGPIKLVLFDVDGVLTDGSLILDGNGEVVKRFNARDGIAIALLRAHGISSGIISGKSSASLDYRIRQLSFDIAETGNLNKLKAYRLIKSKLGLMDSQIAYIGDDVVDLPLTGVVGFFYAPADAHELVKQRADCVLNTNGGYGVARELAEHLLKSTGMEIEKIYEPLIHQWDEHATVQ